MSQVVYLTYEDFIDVLREFPSEYEAFCERRDLSLQRLRPSEDYCKLCQANGHHLTTCPLVLNIPNQQLVISRYNFSFPNERAPYKRLRKPFAARSNAPNVNYELRQLRVNYSGDVDDCQLPIEDLLDEEITDKEFFMRAPRIALKEDEILNLIYQNKDDQNDDEYFYSETEDFNDEKSCVSESRDASRGAREASMLSHASSVQGTAQRGNSLRQASILADQDDDRKSKNGSYMAAEQLVQQLGLTHMENSNGAPSRRTIPRVPTLEQDLKSPASHRMLALADANGVQAQASNRGSIVIGSAAIISAGISGGGGTSSKFLEDHQSNGAVRGAQHAFTHKAKESMAQQQHQAGASRKQNRSQSEMAEMANRLAQKRRKSIMLDPSARQNRFTLNAQTLAQAFQVQPQHQPQPQSQSQIGSQRLIPPGMGGVGANDALHHAHHQQHRHSIENVMLSSITDIIQRSKEQVLEKKGLRASFSGASAPIQNAVNVFITGGQQVGAIPPARERHSSAQVSGRYAKHAPAPAAPAPPRGSIQSEGDTVRSNSMAPITVTISSPIANSSGGGGGVAVTGLTSANNANTPLSKVVESSSDSQDKSFVSQEQSSSAIIVMGSARRRSVNTLPEGSSPQHQKSMTMNQIQDMFEEFEMNIAARLNKYYRHLAASGYAQQGSSGGNGGGGGNSGGNNGGGGNGGGLSYTRTQSFNTRRSRSNTSLNQRQQSSVINQKLKAHEFFWDKIDKMKEWQSYLRENNCKQVLRDHRTKLGKNMIMSKKQSKSRVELTSDYRSRNSGNYNDKSQFVQHTSYKKVSQRGINLEIKSPSSAAKRLSDMMK